MSILAELEAQKGTGLAKERHKIDVKKIGHVEYQITNDVSWPQASSIRERYIYIYVPELDRFSYVCSME